MANFKDIFNLEKIAEAGENAIKSPSHFIDRGLTLETVKNKKLGYAPKGFYQLQISISQTARTDEYKYILPFLDDDGNPEYIMAEYADRENKPENLSKYRKPKDIPSKYYNEKYLRSKTSPEFIFICEGVYDAISIEQSGGQSIALDGTAYNKLLEICKDYKPKTNFILYLDNDEAGKKATEKLKVALDEIGYFAYAPNVPPQYKDANEFLIYNGEGLKTFVEYCLTMADIKKNEWKDAVASKEMEILRQATETKERLDFISTLPDMVDGKPISTSYKNICAVSELLGWKIRKNLVTKDIDIFFNDEIQHISIDLLADELASILPQYRLTQNSGTIRGKISSIGEINQYSPVCHYLSNLSQKWHNGDKDYIGEVFDSLKLKDPINKDFYKILFTRWLIYTVKAAFNNEGKITGEGVLVLRGNQGIGKSRFFGRLVPDESWYGKGQTLDPRQKDDILRVCGVWICELGELGSTLKSDQNRLKAFITNGTDLIRPPYAATVHREQRRTAFCGSVNETDFLIDETGNRRYWILDIEDINNEKSIDIDMMWAQVMYLAFQKNERHWLDRAELNKLNDLNKNFEKLSSEEQAILDSFDWNASPSQQLSASEVCEALKFPMNSCVKIGKILTKLINDLPDKIIFHRSGNKKIYILPTFKNK